MSVPQAMLALTRGEIALVDIRPLAQRSLGHISSDVHIPLAELSPRKGELPGNKRLVFYCSCPAEELALDAAREMMRGGEARVAVLVGGYDAWRTAGGKFQVDATWEETFRVDESPVRWGKTPVDTTRCRYVRDGTVSFRGGSSGRISCVPVAESRGFAGFSQRVDASRLRGRTVSLSAMVRSDKIERAAFLLLAAEDAQGRVMPLTSPEADPVTGTGDWRQVKVTSKVPPDAARLIVGISLMTAGRLWIDDVRLVAEEPGLPSVRVVIENHGFEE